MSGCAIALLAVLLLPGPDETEAVAASPVSKSAPAPAAETTETARITSRTSDFDRKAGVILFEGDVIVRYSKDFTMCADRLYMFLTGTNELSRVVAIGDVSLTNANRVGTCAMATYRRSRNEVEMHWDGKNVLARLAEGGRGTRSLAGTDIKFWLDSHQVEVSNARIEADKGNGRKGLKGL